VNEKFKYWFEEIKNKQLFFSLGIDETFFDKIARGDDTNNTMIKQKFFRERMFPLDVEGILEEHPDTIITLEDFMHFIKRDELSNIRRNNQKFYAIRNQIKNNQVY
jgi:hypothetical protein